MRMRSKGRNSEHQARTDVGIEAINTAHREELELEISTTLTAGSSAEVERVLGRRKHLAAEAVEQNFTDKGTSDGSGRTTRGTRAEGVGAMQAEIVVVTAAVAIAGRLKTAAVIFALRALAVRVKASPRKGGDGDDEKAGGGRGIGRGSRRSDEQHIVIGRLVPDERIRRQRRARRRGGKGERERSGTGGGVSGE